ncbi:MAG: aspartate-semialdehyde dehydrogenase [Gammaproteobacteria bacterium]|nr:aspartate-semialdehyde dehydrogenase [Gammaproteobacteria bacterium]
MSQLFDLAIVGAANAAGEIILELLEERAFPVGTLYTLDIDNSVAKVVQFNNKSHKIKAIPDFDFSKVHIAIFVTDVATSSKYVPEAVAAGCVVIDNSSAFRNEDDIPLVVADINAAQIAKFSNRKIIASLSSISGLIVIALNSLHQVADINRINITTYQSVSDLDKKGISELAGQTANLLNMQPVKIKVYPKQIAFNVLPQIGAVQANGYTQEEIDIVADIRKVLGKASIGVNVTAVRVPVFYGDGAALHIETRDKLGAAEARDLLKKSAGITLIDGKKVAEYPTAVTEASGSDDIFVGRIREDISFEHGLDLWVVADRIRKCEALNSVQIAEILVKDYL